MTTILKTAIFKTTIIAAFCLAFALPARADVPSKAVRETVEYVSKMFSKEAGEEGLEVLAKKIEQLAAKHGDEGLEVVRKLGPRALRAADEAGANSAAAIRAMSRFGEDGLVWVAKRPEGLELAAKYGDDAAEVLVKHKQVAEPLLRESGESAVRAFKAVDPQNGRLLAIMAADRATAPLARNPQLLDVVGKYGDSAVKFIWRNKGKLAAAGVLAAFLADPQPFIDGTRQLTVDLASTAMQPFAEVPNTIARSTNWTLLGIVVVLVGGLAVGWRMFLRHRAELKRKAEPIERMPRSADDLR